MANTTKDRRNVRKTRPASAFVWMVVDSRGLLLSLGNCGGLEIQVCVPLLKPWSPLWVGSGHRAGGQLIEFHKRCCACQAKGHLRVMLSRATAACARKARSYAARALPRFT